MSEKYKRLLQKDGEEQDFWPSLTDLLSSILLVVLLFFMAVIMMINTDLKESEKALAAQTEEIEKKQAKINELETVQGAIVEELQSEFEKANIKMEIDKETGAIKFSDDLLFEVDQSILKDEFKAQLDKFLPIYFNALYSKHGDYIAEIVVEGHTDDVGTYMYNLDLSQQRAHSVVRYVLGDEIKKFPFKEQVQQHITANGRSFSQLKMVDGKVDRAQSRRVEFKFRLKNKTEENE